MLNGVAGRVARSPTRPGIVCGSVPGFRKLTLARLSARLNPTRLALLPPSARGLPRPRGGAGLVSGDPAAGACPRATVAPCGTCQKCQPANRRTNPSTDADWSSQARVFIDPKRPGLGCLEGQRPLGL